jgi:hypothetical protein
MDEHHREALLKEYGEVCNNFRLLTDIRFKLLAFVPIVTAAAAVLKGGSFDAATFTLSLFGLAATIGLMTYNARNDQLYDELVGRAAAIERSLGISDGAFANRPRPWLTVRLLGIHWTIDHRTGIGLIYGASITLWLFGLLAPILEIARVGYVRLSAPYFMVSDPSAWVQMSALGLAVLFTLLTIRAFDVQRKARMEEMRFLAAAAFEQALSIHLSDAGKDERLIGLCAKLANETPDTIGSRAKFYSSLDAESLSHYLPCGSPQQIAAQFVALLTDLPPRWIFDSATKRRA